MVKDGYLKQKKIGLISFVGFFPIFLVSLFLLCFYNLGSCYISTFINLIFSFIFSLLFIISILKNNSFSKILQIFTFLLVSIYTSIVNKNPADVTAIIFFAFSLILVWSYFRERLKFYVIIFIFFILLFSVALLNFAVNDILNSLYANINFDSCLFVIKNSFINFFATWIPVVSFLFLFISFLYIALISEIVYYFEKSNKLQIALYKSESDAWYGRNVIGVVHNIKNKLTPVYLLLDEFSRDERIDKEMRDFCKNQIKSVSGLSGLLDKLMYSTKIKHKEDIETINVNKTVASVAEFFKSNLEFKKNINLNIKQSGKDIYFHSNPMNFCFVVENIIKNSYDNLKKLDRIKKIDIEIVSKDNEKYLSIKDNGTGIVFIKEDEFKGSLLDCSFFKMGNTTKKDGLGYGMEFIKGFVVDNRIVADIYTKKGVGTEIKIYF